MQAGSRSRVLHRQTLACQLESHFLSKSTINTTTNPSATRLSATHQHHPGAASINELYYKTNRLEVWQNIKTLFHHWWCWFVVYLMAELFHSKEKKKKSKGMKFVNNIAAQVYPWLSGQTFPHILLSHLNLVAHANTQAATQKQKSAARYAHEYMWKSTRTHDEGGRKKIKIK